MSNQNFETVLGKVVRANGEDFSFQVKIQGRCFSAEPFYLGTKALIHVDDQVVILGSRGILVLIAPIDNACFLTD